MTGRLSRAKTALMLTKAFPDASGARSNAPRVEAQVEGVHLACRLSGAWNTQTVAGVDDEMRALEQKQGVREAVIDLSAVSAMDTAGAWLVKRLSTGLEAQGAHVEVQGASSSSGQLLVAVDDAAHQEIPKPVAGRPTGVIGLLDSLGRNVFTFRDDFLMSMHILGATIRGAQMKLGRGHAVNPAAIVSQMDKMGIGAIPVVLLMSSIIGAIIAQQGAFQLRYFGAEIFVVDLVGILVLREIGVLLTAIMIAGRSGSAITAEIGSMKMREEIDALTVIGLNPVGVLVFPRLVALVVVLPCLTIAANFAAIIGAIVVSQVYSGISPTTFIDRMRDAIDLSTVFAGLIKAPFMALIIGIIASVEGLKVGGSAESLGTHVTSSVVKSIFVVIVVDGLFAMFYAAIDF
ncbi:phospholipid/cholesterol/gamma-HCH transport system permease protein [Mesorhizobium australicum]|uniref:Phospholipid/cholesterol/gamma-HCH transport system permease protein n=2 Tax=Mesorhizobium australicum TaxID=536018 RepID=A0A1X7P326_9HYPH|nr:phospholipid/cholesterol/gamma-HCH transport system permease protein [Mesorhizobium australicum]